MAKTVGMMAIATAAPANNRNRGASPRRIAISGTYRLLAADMLSLHPAQGAHGARFARGRAGGGGRIGAGLGQRMAGLAWHARRTGLDGGRRRLAGDDRFETQIVVMASDSDAVS